MIYNAGPQIGPAINHDFREIISRMLAFMVVIDKYCYEEELGAHLRLLGLASYRHIDFNMSAGILWIHIRLFCCERENNIRSVFDLKNIFLDRRRVRLILDP